MVRGIIIQMEVIWLVLLTNITHRISKLAFVANSKIEISFLAMKFLAAPLSIIIWTSFLFTIAEYIAIDTEFMRNTLQGLGEELIHTMIALVRESFVKSSK